MNYRHATTKKIAGRGKKRETIVEKITGGKCWRDNERKRKAEVKEMEKKIVQGKII